MERRVVWYMNGISDSRLPEDGTPVPKHIKGKVHPKTGHKGPEGE